MVEFTFVRVEVFDDCMEDIYKDFIYESIKTSWEKKKLHHEPIMYLRKDLSSRFPNIIWGTHINRTSDEVEWHRLRAALAGSNKQYMSATVHFKNETGEESFNYLCVQQVSK